MDYFLTCKEQQEELESNPLEAYVPVHKTGISMLIATMDHLKVCMDRKTSKVYIKIADAIDWYDRELLAATSEKERKILANNVGILRSARIVGDKVVFQKRV